MSILVQVPFSNEKGSKGLNRITLNIKNIRTGIAMSLDIPM